MPESRHHELLDAAVSDMLTHGVHNLKVERVAKAAGVAKGTVYLYFPTKAELITAGLERGLILDEIPELLSPYADGLTEDNLDDFLDHVWTALEERQEILQIIANDGLGLLGPQARASLADTLASIATLLPAAPTQALAAQNLMACILTAFLADHSRRQLPMLADLLQLQLR